MGVSVSLACGVMEELVIIGAGVSGLSCLNALLDRHVSPLLLDASMIGTPKLCGEFLAPNAAIQLQDWGLRSIESIKKVCFFSEKTLLDVTFTQHAGAYSRHDAEHALAVRAQKLGGRIQERVPIKRIIPAHHNQPHVLELDNGDVVFARCLIVATGKLSYEPQSSFKTTPYIGFKTHIPLVLASETLQMHALLGGYLGIVPVSPTVSNLTCLVQRRLFEAAGSCSDFLMGLMATCPRLQDSLDTLTVSSLDWLKGDAPRFGIKTTPPWPQTYWIGDAYASVHPAIGYGFGHAVNSALMAAKHYVNHDVSGYHQAIYRQLRPKRTTGLMLHHVLQTPWACRWLSRVANSVSWLTPHVLKRLDY